MNDMTSLFVSRQEFFSSQASVLCKRLDKNGGFHHLTPAIIAKLSAGDYSFSSIEIDIIAKCCNKNLGNFAKNSLKYSLFYLLFTLCSSAAE